MDITLYRYTITGANWGVELVTNEFLNRVVNSFINQPFIGYDEETQYGITQSGRIEDIVFGLLVQKFPYIITDYDTHTKEEIKEQTIDCGEYLFLIDFKSYEVFLQSKRSSHLPNKEEIVRRFIDCLLRALYDNFQLIFTDLVESKETVDRDKIIHIFYEESDKVIELELEGFDSSLILSEKEKRGRRQTYFNPIEEYQEAMEESAIRLAQHAEKTYVKAKQGESLKKDPITRAMLEGAKKPVKIVFEKEQKTQTEFGVKKEKIKITLEGNDYELPEQIDKIFESIYSNNGIPIKNQKKKKKKGTQGSLFD